MSVLLYCCRWQSAGLSFCKYQVHILFHFLIAAPEAGATQLTNNDMPRFNYNKPKVCFLEPILILSLLNVKTGRILFIF